MNLYERTLVGRTYKCFFVAGDEKPSQKDFLDGEDESLIELFFTNQYIIPLRKNEETNNHVDKNSTNEYTGGVEKFK